MRLAQPGDLAFLVLAALLGACALPPGAYRRPVMPRADREALMVSEGLLLPWEDRDAFTEGRVIPGMSWELLDLLYGRADRVVRCPAGAPCNVILFYGANDWRTVGSVSLEADTVVKATGQFLHPCPF